MEPEGGRSEVVGVLVLVSSVLGPVRVDGGADDVVMLLDAPVADPVRAENRVSVEARCFKSKEVVIGEEDAVDSPNESLR